MSNKFLKKTVAATTTIATTLSLSGVSLLAPVFTATAVVGNIMEGDTIKTASSPDVYIAKYVGSKNFKRLILNPEVFESYGHLDWADIKTVSEADMAMFTMSDLVRAVDDPKVYRLSSAANSDTGDRQWMNMTAAEFVSEGYDWDSIYEINQVDRDNYTMGSDVTVGGGTPPTGSYSVSLASDNPAAGTLMDKSAFNEVLRVSVSAGSSAVNITALTVERFGITQDTDVSGIGIFDSMGKRHGNVLTLSSKQSIFDFASDPISIAAGSTGIVSVRIHIADAAQTGTVGMKLVSMTGDPSGLPVQGNEFSLANGANVLGEVQADINTQTTSQVSVNVGVTDQLLTKLSLGETSGNEDVWLKSVAFQQNGSAADADVESWNLVAPTGTVLATVANSADKVVKFDLSADPWLIDNGTTDVFDIKVDVVNGTSRTVQAVVQNDYDIELVGKDTGVSILPTADTTDTDDDSFPIGDVTDEDTLSIGSGTLTLSKATGSPSGSVAAGATDLTLATFELKVEGEDMEVRQLDFYFAALTAPDNNDSGSTANEPDDVLTGTVKLVRDLNGATVYSVAAGNAAPGTSEETVTLSSYFTIKAGTTEKLNVVGNVREDVDSNDSFQFALQDVYVKRSVTGDFSTQAASEVTANTLTGTTGSLTAIKNQGVGDATLIASSNTLLGSFILQTGSAEGVNVTAIAPDISGTGVAAADIDSWWMEVDNGQKCDSTTSKRFGNVDTSPALTTDSFTGNLNIPVSSQVVLDVCADMSSTVAADDAPVITLPANDVDGTTSQSQQAVDNGSTAATGQTMTIRTAGVLKVRAGTNPVAGVMNISDAGVKVAEVEISPLYEDVKITEFRFWAVASTTLSWTDVSLYKGTTPLQTKAADATTRGVYDYTGLSETIAKGATQTYAVYVGTTDANALSKASIAKINFASVEAQGLSSGNDILEYDGLGYGGTVTTEPGHTSSIGHYRRGDVVFTNNAHGTTTPFGIVIGDENEATSTSVSGLDLGYATNTTFSSAQYISKVGGAALAHAPRQGALTTGIAALDFVLVHDTSANRVYHGIVDALVANTSITINSVHGTSTVTLASGDTSSELAGTGYDAAIAAGADFTTAPATGSLVYYYDDSNASTSQFGIVTRYRTDTAQDGVSNSDNIQIDGTALDETAATGTNVTDGDKYFAFTMDINSATFTTTSLYDFNVGDLVYHYDASSAASSNFAIVTTGVRSGETMANLVTTIATVATGDRIAQIAPTGIGTNSWTMHDGEPIATVDNSGIGTASQQAMQDIARYKITAVGANLTIESLTLNVFGSGADALTTTSNGIEVWVDGVREFQSGDLSPVAEAGTDFDIDFANEINIAAGSTKTFLVKINTLGHSTVNETVSVKLGGNKGHRGGPIDFYYTSTGSVGTVPTASSPANITDSELPLLGVSVTP